MIEAAGPAGKPTKVLRLKQGGKAGKSNSMLQQVRTSEGGKRYKIGLWYKADVKAKAAKPEYIICWLTLYPGNFPKAGARWVQVVDSVDPGRWKRLEQTFSTPSGFAGKEAAGRMQVELRTYSELVSISYDDIELVEMPTSPSPGPGATTKGGPIPKRSSSDQAGAGGGQGVVFYVVPATRDALVLPNFPSVPKSVSHDISMAVSPGEYEPASFVVHAKGGVSNLSVTATELRAAQAVVPAASVDIRVVKCWYQSSRDTLTKVGKFLLPELLLKDDSLVKVDFAAKENFLKLRFSGGDRYVSISREDGIPIPGISTFPQPDEFPVKDSALLLPVDVPKGTNKQFWVTVRAPEDAVPGVYSGKIELRAGDRVVGRVKLRVRILPIKLLPPYYTSSIFYDGRLHPEGKDPLGIDKRPEGPLKRELENLAAHGATNPVFREGFADRELFEKHLRFREEVGMDNEPLFYTLTTRNPSSAEDLASLEKKVKQVLAMCKQHGISDVYFYGIDEAQGELLSSQRSAWEVTRKAGGKIYVAGYSMHDEDIKLGNFELMGDIQDVLVCAHAPRRDEAAKWHGAGHKIFCYGGPQFGLVKPETYRRNYGLVIWQNDYDGVMNFNYYTGAGPAWGNVWNDFDGAFFIDHNMVYPTIDGVIDTTQWEGYREGVDDIRYLTTLLDAIERAKKARSRAARREATSAEKYLAELKDMDLGGKSLNAIRFEMIRRILRLQRGE